MKLFRYGRAGEEKPGVVYNHQYFDASSVINDYDASFWASGGIKSLQDALDSHLLQSMAQPERLGTPVSTPSKIVCVGLNYRDHAIETGANIPVEPILFMKSTTAFNGPFDDVKIPRGSEGIDWEVELAVVISKKATYIEMSEADDYIAGYTIMNDYSERTFQKHRGGQFTKGKSADTFAPCGPYLVTVDEVADVQNLSIWLKVNGERRQDSNTSEMIFSVPFLVHYISQFMTLLPGDIICTGTPSGVGLGMKPQPVYLKEGDLVEMGIDHLDQMHHTIRRG